MQSRPLHRTHDRGKSQALLLGNQFVIDLYSPQADLPLAMPVDRRSRSLGTLAGVGYVYAGDKLVAKVRFSLTVTQGVHGQKDIRGVINILHGERHVVEGSTLVLELGDGHRWEFFPETGNFISGEYLVVGTGRQDIFTS